MEWLSSPDASHSFKPFPDLPRSLNAGVAGICAALGGVS